MGDSEAISVAFGPSSQGVFRVCGLFSLRGSLRGFEKKQGFLGAFGRYRPPGKPDIYWGYQVVSSFACRRSGVQVPSSPPGIRKD